MCKDTSREVIGWPLFVHCGEKYRFKHGVRDMHDLFGVFDKLSCGRTDDYRTDDYKSTHLRENYAVDSRIRVRCAARILQSILDPESVAPGGAVVGS